MTFKKVMGLLKFVGYVEHFKGGNCRNSFHIAGGESKPFYPGLASRYLATKDLLAIVCSFGIEPGDVSCHYYTKLPSDVLTLKAASSRWNATEARGQAMRIKDSREVLELRNQVRKINQYLSQQNMEGAVFLLGTTGVSIWGTTQTLIGTKVGGFIIQVTIAIKDLKRKIDCPSLK